MISEKTLVSISMLMLKKDMNQDFIDYFVPFVIATLKRINSSDTIQDAFVSSRLKELCGLNIPSRPMQIILKRLAREGILEKNDHVFKINKVKLLEKEDVFEEKKDVQVKIENIIKKFQIFYQKERSEDISPNDAINTFMQFFNKHLIQTMRLVIGDSEQKNEKYNDLIVGKFILDAQKNDMECFANIVILLKGYIIANAITTNEYESVKQFYKDVSFYFDTSLILDLCDFHNPYSHNSAVELVDLIKKIGGHIYVFSKTKDEVDSVIDYAISYMRKRNGGVGNKIVRSAKEKNMEVSELELKKIKLQENLSGYGITIVQDPIFNPRFNIDENELRGTLDSHIKYRDNAENAENHDVRAIQSIYLLRKEKIAQRVEDSVALFVTDNTEYARAAQDFAGQYKSGLAPVVTSFFLANQAWLKCPFSDSSLPQNELLSVAYASQKPSNDFLRKYLEKVDILVREQNLKEDDYLLFTSIVREEEIMDATQGDDELLTATTLLELREIVQKRVSKEQTLDFIKRKAARYKRICRNVLIVLSVLLSIFAFIGIFIYDNKIINIIINIIAWSGLLFGFAFVKWFDKVSIWVEKKYIENNTNMLQEKRDY